MHRGWPGDFVLDGAGDARSFAAWAASSLGGVTLPDEGWMPMQKGRSRRVCTATTPERATMSVSSGHDFCVGDPQRSRFDPQYKVCKVWRGGERETYGAP